MIISWSLEQHGQPDHHPVPSARARNPSAPVPPPQPAGPAGPPRSASHVAHVGSARTLEPPAQRVEQNSGSWPSAAPSVFPPRPTGKNRITPRTPALSCVAGPARMRVSGRATARAAPRARMIQHRVPAPPLPASAFRAPPRGPSMKLCAYCSTERCPGRSWPAGRGPRKPQPPSQTAAATTSSAHEDFQCRAQPSAAAGAQSDWGFSLPLCPAPQRSKPLEPSNPASHRPRRRRLPSKLASTGPVQATSSGAANLPLCAHVKESRRPSRRAKPRHHAEAVVPNPRSMFGEHGGDRRGLPPTVFVARAASCCPPARTFRLPVHGPV